MVKFCSLLLLCLITVVTKSAPIENDSDAEILHNEYTIDEEGNYKFSFETTNGITREETGTIINKGQSDEYMLVKGLLTYINSEGDKQIIGYIADKDGYKVPTSLVETPIGLSPSLVASLLGK